MSSRSSASTFSRCQGHQHFLHQGLPTVLRWLCPQQRQFPPKHGGRRGSKGLIIFIARQQQKQQQQQTELHQLNCQQLLQPTNQQQRNEKGSGQQHQQQRQEISSGSFHVADDPICLSSETDIEQTQVVQLAHTNPSTSQGLTSEDGQQHLQQQIIIKFNSSGKPQQNDQTYRSQQNGPQQRPASKRTTKRTSITLNERNRPPTSKTTPSAEYIAITHQNDRQHRDEQHHIFTSHRGSQQQNLRHHLMDLILRKNIT